MTFFPLLQPWLIKLNFICFHTTPTSPILLKGKDYTFIPVLSASTTAPDSECSENSLNAHYFNGIYVFMLCLSTGCNISEAVVHTSLYRNPLQPLWCSKSKRSSINLWIGKIILQLETVFLITDFFFQTDLKSNTTSSLFLQDPFLELWLYILQSAGDTASNSPEMRGSVWIFFLHSHSCFLWP